MSKNLIPFAVSSFVCFFVARSWSAELEIRVDNPPDTGAVVALLFDSANNFVDVRDPVRTVVSLDGGKSPLQILNLPVGEYAVIVFHDENDNGFLDKNFIGIPREGLGFSNRYWPEGPPSFVRASFRLGKNETKIIDVHLRTIFGKRGLLGVGLGAITQTSPYRGSRRVILQPIPAVSYIGDRVQIFGPRFQGGILKTKNIGLAVTAEYRLGAYDEKDSPSLEGLGDRAGTLMAGFATQLALPGGVGLTAGYGQDVLNRFNGGIARLGVDKSLQWGLFTFSPQLGLNWMSEKLANYEFGVKQGLARPHRPAYMPGDAFTAEYGLGVYIELAGAWRIILNGNAAQLPSAITKSSIVDKSQVITGFAAVTRLF